MTESVIAIIRFTGELRWLHLCRFFPEFPVDGIFVVLNTTKAAFTAIDTKSAEDIKLVLFVVQSLSTSNFTTFSVI